MTKPHNIVSLILGHGAEGQTAFITQPQETGREAMGQHLSQCVSQGWSQCLGLQQGRPEGPADRAPDHLQEGRDRGLALWG